MLTHGQMYLLLQLDNIKEMLTLTIALTSVISILSGIMFIMLNELLDQKILKNICYYGKVSCIVAISALVINTLLPNTKSMAAIIVVPAIVNNEKVQTFGGKTVDVGNELLDFTKQYIESKINENKKD